MLRYLNMFVLIGLALIGISLIGFMTGNRFLTEPGQAPNRYSSLIYLGAGLLMLINGAVSVRVAPPLPAPADKEKKSSSEAQERAGTSL
jgi:hypothetical protein